MPRLNNFKKSIANAKDEYFTPPVLVRPILEHIPRAATVWCPFDTEDSEFVRLLRAGGNAVIASHIWNGQDFFHWNPKEHYDIIVSNPPFTKKMDVLERLYAIDKPFAMILGLPILNYQEVGSFFLGKKLQLLIVDKKVSFDGNTSSFNSSYFCHRLLPESLMFTHLPHNNSGKNFEPSKMYLQWLRNRG